MTMKRHYNGIDLFNAMLRLARESGKFDRCDAILDYALAKGKDIILTNYKLETRCTPTFGGSEGIYIEVHICGEYSHSEYAQRIVSIGALKTLGDSLEDMMIMGEACGLLTYCAYDFVNENFDAFSEEGTDIDDTVKEGESSDA